MIHLVLLTEALLGISQSSRLCKRHTLDQEGAHVAKLQFEDVYAMVRRIPKGKVATYGEIALFLGWPQGARTVGWALRALPPGSGVPWHRVVNAQGKISLPNPEHQRELLEAEGVIFNASDRIDLLRFGWSGLEADNAQN